jgi:phosphatidylethanolamine/phosphatidyl-N-methylethanolamine N-methyltransferase
MGLLEGWLKIRYSIYSPLYDALVGKAFMAQRERSIGLAEIKSEHKVLIIGAGTGLDLNYLLHCKDITVVDVAEGMLNKLRKRAQKLGVPVTVKIMDARNLSFPDNNFDVVILHLIIAVIPEFKIAIREVERVLKPGGTAMIFDKFLPNNKKPNHFRILINPFAILIATNLNLRLNELIKDLKFQVTNDEKAGWGGLLRIIKLKKLS